MTKDYIFIEKKRNYPFWISIVVILFLIGIVGKMEKDKLLLEQDIKFLQSNHVHTWIMDESCSDQLTGSDILRIKLSK